MNDKNTLGETPYQVALHWQKGEVANLFVKKNAPTPEKTPDTEKKSTVEKKTNTEKKPIIEKQQ